HRRGHETDPVPVDPQRSPADLHVLRRLPALDPASQEPGDCLRGEVQLVRDLFLGEALLLVFHGPPGNRIHVLHPFTHSVACDAGFRISKYRPRTFAPVCTTTAGLRAWSRNPVARTIQTGILRPSFARRQRPNSSEANNASPVKTGPSAQTSWS